MIKALSYYSLRELPPEDSGEDVWIKAIALATKYDGNDYFIGIEKDPLTLKPRVKKDFGPTSAIVSVKAVFPYLYLSAEFMPKGASNKDAKIGYLAKYYDEAELHKHSVKELDKMIIGVAIRQQLLHEGQARYYEQINAENEQDRTEEEVGGCEVEAED